MAALKRTCESSSGESAAARAVSAALGELPNLPADDVPVGEGESATLVRGEDRYGHFRPEPACARDFAPEAVAFQREVERRKHQVYDRA